MTSDVLRKCTGYRVEAGDRRIGSVAAVVPPQREGRTGSVIVQSGPRCGLSAVAFDAVERIDPERRILKLANVPVQAAPS